MYPYKYEDRIHVTTQLCMNYCPDWAPVLEDGWMCTYNCRETESFIENGRCSATCSSGVYYYSGWNGTKLCSDYVCSLYEIRKDDQNPPGELRLCR